MASSAADAASAWPAREQEALAKGLFLFGKNFNSIACLFDTKKVRSRGVPSGRRRSKHGVCATTRDGGVAAGATRPLRATPRPSPHAAPTPTPSLPNPKQPVDVARYYYAHFKYTRAHESWRHHLRKGFQGASLVTGIKQKPLLTKISSGELVGRAGRGQMRRCWWGRATPAFRPPAIHRDPRATTTFFSLRAPSGLRSLESWAKSRP